VVARQIVRERREVLDARYLLVTKKSLDGLLLAVEPGVAQRVRRVVVLVESEHGAVTRATDLLALEGNAAKRVGLGAAVHVLPLTVELVLVIVLGIQLLYIRVREIGRSGRRRPRVTLPAADQDRGPGPREGHAGGVEVTPVDPEVRQPLRQEVAHLWASGLHRVIGFGQARAGYLCVRPETEHTLEHPASSLERFEPVQWHIEI